jgi:DHA1 family tetracycline resistance protein-like MFS transporter
MSKSKLIIVLTVFIDIMGIGLVIPVLPIYVEQMTHSVLAATVLFSVFSFCGFFASPILGSLSDRYGRRPVLLGSIFGTSVGWFIFAIGGSYPWLLLGRIIDGITSGNISTAQSSVVIATVTPLVGSRSRLSGTATGGVFTNSDTKPGLTAKFPSPKYSASIECQPRSKVELV